MGARERELGMNLNSRTHEQINQSDSRQDAKARRGNGGGGGFNIQYPISNVQVEQLEQPVSRQDAKAQRGDYVEWA